MNQSLLVKLFQGISLYLVITTGKKDEPTTHLGYLKVTTHGVTKLSDTTILSGGQRKTDWATLFARNTSNTTTLDALVESSSFDSLCSRKDSGNSSFIIEHNKNSTLIDLCKIMERCNGNITTEFSNCSLTVHNTTDGNPGNPCLDIKLCNNSISVELLTMSVEQMTTQVEHVTTTVELVTIPIELITTSADLVTTPLELMTAPVELMTTPVELVTTNMELMTTSVEQMTTPVEIMTTPVKLMNTPVEQMMTPVEEVTTPVELMTTPVEQVMKPVKEVTMVPQIDPCCNVGTCSFTGSMKHKFCRCDKYCKIYNDCCIDADKTQNKSRYSPFINCYKGNSLPNYEGFFAVDSCPNTYSNITEKLMCTEDNIIRNGPCVVSQDGVIFKNQYCALCHGINAVHFFLVSFHVQHLVLLDKVLKTMSNLSRTAKLEFMFGYTTYQEISPAHITPRTCILPTIRNTEELCQAYINPVFTAWQRTSQDFYRNYFCVQGTKQNLSKCLGTGYDKIALGGRWRALPISVMFAFVKKKTHNVEDACDVWSQKLDEEGRCLEKERISNFKLNFHFIKLVANKPLSSKYVNMIGNLFGLSHEVDNSIVLIAISYLGVENASTILINYIDLTIHTTMFIEEMEKLKERMANMQWKMHIIDEQLEYETIIIKETFIQQRGKATVFDIYENVTGIRTNELRGAAGIKIKRIIPSNDQICDNTIVIVSIRNTTNVSLLCEDHSIVPYDITFIKTITTYICFSMSVLALFLLIIFYRKLGLSSSIPGSNLENISISLVMSKVLFMVGIGLSDIRELCYVIGVLLHYLWLSTFYFMSVSVMCIVINLTKMQSNGHNRKDSLNNKKRCLTLGGMLFPLLFVCPAIFLDVYGDEYFSSGYGKEPCFPNHFPSNLMFFSGPVMLSIAINFICLVKVMFTIGRLSREIGHISMSTPFTNAKVYIRVLVLSGLFWSIGILTAFLDDEWIEFLFTILCGLQGFFISLASLTTKRVIRDFRRLKQSTVRTITNSSM